MLYTTCLGLFLPLLGFLILMTLSKTIGRRLTSFIACLTVFVSFTCFLCLLYHTVYNDINPVSFILYKWIAVSGIDVNFKLSIDPLSLVMTLIVTGVGFLIHVYSIGYIEDEKDFARYFACMNFFIFAMLLLVLAGDLLILFIGWEGVGLASYLLIGYWYERPLAAQAATKAFVINRIGDLGLLLGLLLTFQLFGTGDINDISTQVGEKFIAGAPIITILTLLYFVGAVGKSAQIPLHVWLPDAMEGPTPVSALIHAATMVTAGVYLVVRLHSVFILAPLTLYIVGIIGGVTALFAALCALAQTDLKRVLAYSTISQLGLMFLACGVGAFYAAIFHLTTHAFVKALLFLSAGNVVHLLHGATDMGKMGGLSKIFKKTHWFFLIGVLALSGVPPLAAFFSKDLILEQEYLTGFYTLFYLGLIASILTAFYMTRAYCLTFLGPTHLDNHLRNTVKEAPKIMLIPITVLAFLSIVGGFFGFALVKKPILEEFLAEIGVTLAENETGIDLLKSPETWLSIAGALFGVGLAAFLYTRFVNRLGSPIQFLKRAFYIDDVYRWIFVIPVSQLSKLISQFLEPRIFDGAVQVIEQLSKKISQWLQLFQSGQVRSYVAWVVIGSVFLFVYFAF